MYKFILVMLLIIVGVHKSIADTGETGELGCSKQRIIRLSIGESWEPYYSETLPNGGVVTEIVRRAFEISGYQIEVTWLPWARAINLTSDRFKPSPSSLSFQCS